MNKKKINKIYNKKIHIKTKMNKINNNNSWDKNMYIVPKKNKYLQMTEEKCLVLIS